MTATPAPHPDREFRADIQGLRAIAVLSVVIYHAVPAALPGGFVGVDIFFVISGFLITGILVRELERGAFSVTGFYHRRIKRLFPALFAMLAAVLAMGAAILPPSEYMELARTTVSTVFFVSNIDFYALSGYFAGEAADKPLLHTWSLAVEEQFYIVYPLLLAAVWKWARAWLAPLAALGVLAAFAVSQWGAMEHRTAAFYLTPFRAFELGLGALVALWPLQLKPVWRDAASLVGVAMMAAAFVALDDSTPFPGLAALLPCAGAALVIAAGTGAPSAGGRMLSLPALTFFGAISYSLYLWHWPLLVFGRYATDGTSLSPWHAAPLAALAVVLATLSWKFIEQPVLRARAPRGWVFGLGGLAMAGATAVAAAIYFADGAPGRFSPQAQRMFAAYEDFNRDRDRCHSDEDNPIPYDRNCLFGAEGASPVVAVWGDSAGAELVVALGEALAPRGQAAMQITSSACGPLWDYQLPERPTCAAHNRETLANLLADARIRTVVIALNFARYPTPEQPLVQEGYTRTVEALLAGGKTVVLAYPFPNPWFESPRELGLRAQLGRPLDTLGVPRATYEADQHAALAFLDRLVARTGAVPFRQQDALCDATFCPVYREGVGVLYFNGNHISVTGARLVVRRFPFETLPPPSHAAAATPTQRL